MAGFLTWTLNPPIWLIYLFSLLWKFPVFLPSTLGLFQATMSTLSTISSRIMGSWTLVLIRVQLVYHWAISPAPFLMLSLLIWLQLTFNTVYVRAIMQTICTDTPTSSIQHLQQKDTKCVRVQFSVVVLFCLFLRKKNSALGSLGWPQTPDLKWVSYFSLPGFGVKTGYHWACLPIWVPIMLFTQADE